jgi:hypothetical protein
LSSPFSQSIRSINVAKNLLCIYVVIGRFEKLQEFCQDSFKWMKTRIIFENLSKNTGVLLL